MDPRQPFGRPIPAVRDLPLSGANQMTLAFDPHVFGSAALTWVSLLTLAGIALTVGLLLHGAARIPAPRSAVYAVALRSVLWGLLGARLLHVADYVTLYADAPLSVLYLWSGGLSLWGGVLGASAGGLWHARRRGIALGRFADGAAVAGLWGLALGRLGDLLVGERPAAATSLPWGIEYAHPDAAAYVDGAAVHPVALYEGLWDLGVLGLLWALRTGRLGRLTQRLGRLARGVLPEGAAFAAAIGAWAAGRLVIGFARIDPSLLGLQQAQWIALVVLAGVAYYAWRERRRVVLSRRS